MIIEIATAAAMYVADATAAAQSDIPQIVPELTCRHRDPKRVQQCLEQKMQQQQTDPYAAMWDADWVSAITPVNEGEQKNTSAKAANPNYGGSKRAVASKPHTRSN